MDFFDDVKSHKKIMIISILFNIIFIISTPILIYKINNQKCICDNDDLLSCNDENIQNEVIKNEQIELKDFHVEIKGAVNTPGVYLVNDNNIINDVVKMAGGFKKEAYTDNINLSHHLSDELVIYVYTTKEYSKKDEVKEEITSCNCPTYDISKCQESFSSVITSENESNTLTESNSESLNNSSNTSDTNVSNNEKIIVNINTASINELMNLSGIGEQKAKDIIAYRNSNGPFKSIEDIKKVNGIKDATFNKIKDNITV